jgi:hypothetical protein
VNVWGFLQALQNFCSFGMEGIAWGSSFFMVFMTFVNNTIEDGC